MRIILDTNFLVYCAKQKIDYVSEMPVSGKLVVLSSVMREIEKIKKQAKKGKDKEAVKFALQILEKNIKNNQVEVLESEEEADKAIINIAEKEDVVATMDKELKKRLKGKARILTIRQKKKLEVL